METEETTRARFGRLVSLMLRLAVASLFLAAAVGKLKGGWHSLSNVVAYFQQTFAETWLPTGLVTLHARLTPFMEALIVVWLIVGFRLKAAWCVTTLFMLSLAFGMAVAGKHDAAANNYTYVLICCVGLYFSRFDRYSFDGLLRTSTSSR